MEQQKLSTYYQPVIASVYSKKSSVHLQASDNGKVLLVMAHANNTNNNKDDKITTYDWKNKKIFKLERHEIYIIKEAIRITLFEGAQRGKEFCKKMLGSKKDSPYFMHQSKNGRIAFGGIIINNDFNNEANEQYSPYSPIVFKIMHKSNHNNVNDDIITCPVSKSHAYQIYEDLNKFLDESARNLARVNVNNN